MAAGIFLLLAIVSLPIWYLLTRFFPIVGFAGVKPRQFVITWLLSLVFLPLFFYLFQWPWILWGLVAAVVIFELARSYLNDRRMDRFMSELSQEETVKKGCDGPV